MTENKKLILATAAVYMYIKTQEEAAAVAMQNRAADVGTGQSPVRQTNLWGLYGRQAIMNAKAMLRQKLRK